MRQGSGVIIEGALLGRLVRYDVTIGWRAASAAFATTRDRLLLVAMAAIGLLALVHGTADAVATLAAMPLAATAVPVAGLALSANLVIARRLAHLAEHSVMARDALHPGRSRRYRLAWNLPLLTLLLAVALASRPSEGMAASFGLLFLAYAMGALFADAARRAGGWVRRWPSTRRGEPARGRGPALPGATRRQRLIALIDGRTALATLSRSANLALFTGMGLSIALAVRWIDSGLTPPVTAAVAALLSLIPIGMLLRQHPPLLRYLLAIGIAPAGPALVPALPAAGLVAGLAIGTIAGGRMPSGPILLAAAAALVLFAVSALARALHYATRRRQAASFALQADVAATAMLALLAAPLALAFVAARLAALERRAQASRYLLP